MRTRRRPVQLSFDDLPRHGGRRRGAGRKPGVRPRVRHRTRAEHRAWRPIHVTLRAARPLASLRSQVLYRAVESAIRATRPEGFRIVCFSVQVDHVHALVEALDGASLLRGMRSLTVRLALRVNRALGRRRGRVLGDRYHRHDLSSPREVRNALVYVLFNVRKHDRAWAARGGLDPCSSAVWFEGFASPRAPPEGDSPVQCARTQLLAWRWKRWGLIGEGEVPRLTRVC